MARIALDADIVIAFLDAGDDQHATAVAELRPRERYPDQVRAFELDVTDRTQADRAVDAALDVFGSLDVLVNNAGYANVNFRSRTSPRSLTPQGAA